MIKITTKLIICENIKNYKISMKYKFKYILNYKRLQQINSSTGEDMRKKQFHILPNLYISVIC